MQNGSSNRERITDEDLLELIKSMHSEIKERDIYKKTSELIEIEEFGITKEYAARRFGVSEKTIQNIMYRMDEKNKDVVIDPVKIAGQEIHLPIKKVRVQNKTLKKNNPYMEEKMESAGILYRDIHYVTEQTMHPIFLQLNMAQVYTLVLALDNLAEQENSNIALSIMVSIYRQLSEYCKRRLKIVDHNRDLKLYNTLYMLSSDDTLDDNPLGFYSEPGMDEMEDLTEEDLELLKQKLRI